jgi:hypothetical protein
MKQEPVAWQWLDTANFRKKLSVNANKDEWTPLYTAPRELSDDEIVDVWGCAEYSIDHDYDGAIKFARAILKKASEK